MTVVKVPLGKALVALIDSADELLVSAYVWHPHNQGYAVGSGGKPLMHRLIMDAPKGVLVDHRDGNKLNNRRVNLRLANYSTNGHNRHTTTGGAPGIRAQKRGTFASYLWVNRRNLYLGSFGTEIEAVKARAEAELSHFGEIGPVTLDWLRMNEGGGSDF